VQDGSAVWKEHGPYPSPDIYGIAMPYAGPDYNSTGSVYAGNRCFDTHDGTNKTQKYGIGDESLSCTDVTIGINNLSGNAVAELDIKGSDYTVLATSGGKLRIGKPDASGAYPIVIDPDPAGGITPNATGLGLGSASKRWGVFGGNGDFSGNLSVGAVPQLSAGHEETGFCSAGGMGAVATGSGAAWETECPINFKTVLSQEPTGVTVTVLSAANVQAIAVRWKDGSVSAAWNLSGGSHTFQQSGKTLGRYGFTLMVASVDDIAQGDAYSFQGTYQTVGN
jgi:hypothetical protein